VYHPILASYPAPLPEKSFLIHIGLSQLDSNAKKIDGGSFWWCLIHFPIQYMGGFMGYHQSTNLHITTQNAS